MPTKQRTAKEADYRAWRWAAALELEQRHNVRAGIIPERVCGATCGNKKCATRSPSFRVPYSGRGIKTHGSANPDQADRELDREGRHRRHGYLGGANGNHRGLQRRCPARRRPRGIDLPPRRTMGNRDQQRLDHGAIRPKSGRLRFARRQAQTSGALCECAGALCECAESLDGSLMTGLLQFHFNIEREQTIK
jgi:hypothetical protein